MKRPDNLSDDRSENRTRVILRFIGFGLLCLISIAVMVLVIWINIRSRLN